MRGKCTKKKCHKPHWTFSDLEKKNGGSSTMHQGTYDLSERLTNRKVRIAPSEIKQEPKTKACTFYRNRGFCKFEQNCKWLHVKHETN